MEAFKVEAILDAARGPNELCRFVISMDDDENDAFNPSFLFDITRNDYKSVTELGEIIQQELEGPAKSAFADIAEVNVEIEEIRSGSLEVILKIIEIGVAVSKVYENREAILKCSKAFIDIVCSHSATLVATVAAYLKTKREKWIALRLREPPNPASPLKS